MLADRTRPGSERSRARLGKGRAGGVGKEAGRRELCAQGDSDRNCPI